jgi:group I intron endonuclease
METNEKIINEPYGFIYITTNMVNGMKYLGQKSFEYGGNWLTYLGSGKVFKCALKKYGKENFYRNIVCFCYSEEELNKTEYELSVFLHVVEDPNWYNLCYGGGAPKGFHMPEEQRIKLSQDRKGTNVGKDNPYFGKHHTDEIKQKLSKFHRNRPQELQDRINQSHMKSVIQYDFDGNIISTYESIKQASEITRIVYSSIQRCCKKERPSAGGFIWRYVNEPLTEEEFIQLKTKLRRKNKKITSDNNNPKKHRAKNNSGYYDSWIKKDGKYQLRFVFQNKYTYLGTFLTEEEVQQAINDHKNNIKK